MKEVPRKSFSSANVMRAFIVPVTQCCLCVFESRHDIKNLTASSNSVSLKTTKPKLEVIPPEDVLRRYILSEHHSMRKSFPKVLAKYLLGISMDPVLNFFYL